MKERAGIVAPLGLLPVLLEAQEGGAWGEANGEGREGEAGQVELEVAAGARIGQAGRDSAPALAEVIKAARVHAPRKAGTAAKVQVANV